MKNEKSKKGFSDIDRWDLAYRKQINGEEEKRKMKPQQLNG